MALAIALDCGWDGGQWHEPNSWGISEENLLKNAKGRLFVFSFVQHYLFFKSLTRPEAVHLSAWEIFVSRVTPVR